MLAQVADTLTFMLIVFWALPRELLIQLIVVQYLFKVAYEILATPLTYLVVNKLKKIEGEDVFDDGVKYNPFSVDVE